MTLSYHQESLSPDAESLRKQASFSFLRKSRAPPGQSAWPEQTDLCVSASVVLPLLPWLLQWIQILFLWHVLQAQGHAFYVLTGRAVSA